MTKVENVCSASQAGEKKMYAYSFRCIISRYIILCITSFLLSPMLQAQLCTGSLGDPVVNITFGNDARPNSSVPTSGYTYTSSACPDDGFYTITKSTSGCFGNTWHTLNDHTGGGAFMLVNASYDPGDFFLTTVSELCPNTTYEFAAWVMNVMKVSNSILPNLTFNVETPDGEVLNSFSTGDIPVTSSPQWKQYGFYFSTPVGNPEIVLRITNNAPGGIGNDLALDDITFRPCGAKIDTEISGVGADTVNVCFDENNPFTYTMKGGTGSGYASPLYQWQASVDRGATWSDIPGATSSVYQTPALKSSGSYWYRLSVVESSVAQISSCKIASEVMAINIRPKPKVNAGPDRTMLAGYPVSLSGSAEGESLSYNWSPDLYIQNGNSLTPAVSPPNDMSYTLTATSAFGCEESDEVNVKVVSGIFVPNAFTPNGDGKNDRWEIPFLDPSFEGQVRVYNRWGQLVYSSSAAPVYWDGTFKGEPQSPGIYTWYLVIPKYNVNMKGSIMLIR